MNKSDTYIAFGEWEETCEELTQEEKGDMADAVFAYWRRGENPAFSDRTMRAVWKFIRNAIDRATDAYEAKCEQNRVNGQKGGAPVGNKNALKDKTSETTERLKKQPKTSETTLPDPYPDPEPNRNPIKRKTKFHNFDERNYSSEQMEEIEKKLGGN